MGAGFVQRLHAGPPVVLDAALGTELERRGLELELPLWTTHALLEAESRIAGIHRDHVRAGAEVLTAATFRTQRRWIQGAGLAAGPWSLTRMAVGLARAAADEADRPVWVAGSAPPLEDCYRPDLVPEDDACEAEHCEHAWNLAWAGADLIAVETMNCIREAVIASRAASATGLPFWVSFVCGSDARLLSGETLAEAIEAVRPSGPAAVGVNCAPAVTLEPCLPVLARSGIPWCIYANLGAPLPDGRFRSHDCSPSEFADQVRKQRLAGARMIGGCCGTAPEHLHAAAAAIAAA